MLQGEEAPPRFPLPTDPNVVVPRFAEALPEVLYSDEFLTALKARFPVISFDQATGVYCEVLNWVHAQLDA